jgi:hypothetical protein
MPILMAIPMTQVHWGWAMAMASLGGEDEE